MKMFGLIVGNFHIDPNYFWDEMTWAEVSELIHAMNERDRTSWEQTRYKCYYSVAPHVKKMKPLREFMPFEWDDETNPRKKASQPSTKARMDELTKKLKLKDNGE